MSSFFGSGEITTSDEFLYDCPGFIRVHKDGWCERFVGIDSSTGVEAKDVVIPPEVARIYIPKTDTPNQKLTVLIYFHGGVFVLGSTTSPVYHPTLNHLTAESNVIVVSVDYRLAPEYPLPVGYNDAWVAIQWVATHGSGHGPDPWLNKFGDFNKVFFGGDSAGANIAHNLAIRVGLDPVAEINLNGIILLHPFFGGSDPIGSELGRHKQLKVFTDQFWNMAKPSGSGLDDPRFNPEKNPNLSGLGCSRILVVVAEKDPLRDRGLYYKELVEKSGWAGKLEMLETKEVDHVFFLFDHASDKACTLYNAICTFINL